MARKRHHKKRTHRRRKHSMSGTGGTVTSALAMVTGAVIGRVLSSKLSDKINPKILAGGQIAVGVLLPKFVKNKFVSGIGTGMIVNGGVQALSSFGVISAISGITDGVKVDYLGDDDFDSISGSADIQEIAGIDDMGMGLVDAGIMSGSSDISIIAGDDDEDFDY
jgi:hypothetical protein